MSNVSVISYMEHNVTYLVDNYYKQLQMLEDLTYYKTHSDIGFTVSFQKPDMIYHR